MNSNSTVTEKGVPSLPKVQGESALGYWATINCYVCLAAALHAVLVVSTFGVLLLFWTYSDAASLTDFFLEAIQWFVFVIIALVILSVLSSILAGSIGIVLCPIFHLMLWTLGVKVKQLYLGGFMGGVIAFACCHIFYGLVALPGSTMTGSFPIEWGVAVLLTLVATAMGQAAGIIAARTIFRDEKLQPCYRLPFHPKFQIKHLLWITFWLALFLAVLRAISLFSPMFWAITGTWLFAQCFTLVAVLKFLARREMKRMTVAERST